MTELINGKEISAYIKNKIKNEVAQLSEKGISVGLAVIIVGDNSASKVYVANKEKACAELGIKSFKYALPESTSNEELLRLIDNLNADERIDGILCQLPLPAHLDEKIIINRISPQKDVDAFQPENVGRIMIGDYSFLPCTPAGIIEMLKYKKIDIASKNCVVIGRSNIVGKPMAMLMLHNDATVTVCHSKTENLKEICRTADILISAVGKAKFVTADMVKNGAVVIDVGMNRDENGKLCGDVDFETVKSKCAAITPVPGGVGPMTIAMLMNNTLIAAKNKQRGI